MALYTLLAWRLDAIIKANISITVSTSIHDVDEGDGEPPRLNTSQEPASRATPREPASRATPREPARVTNTPPEPVPEAPPATEPRKTFKVSWKTVSLFIETYKQTGIISFSLSKIRKDMGIKQDDEKRVEKIKALLGRARVKDLVDKKGNKYVIVRNRQ